MAFPALTLPRASRASLPVARLVARLVAPLMALLVVVAPRVAFAQPVATERLGTECDYRRCAYNIIAALHGLKVVRGETEAPVATLGFLFTRDISPAFAGEGHEAARAAVRTRRWAAVLTDVGLGLLITGAASAAINDLDESAAHLMLGGAASLGLSVPLQFLADKHLARAVWQHNARYAGAPR